MTDGAMFQTQMCEPAESQAVLRDVQAEMRETTRILRVIMVNWTTHVSNPVFVSSQKEVTLRSPALTHASQNKGHVTEEMDDHHEPSTL